MVPEEQASDSAPCDSGHQSQDYLRNIPDRLLRTVLKYLLINVEHLTGWWIEAEAKVHSAKVYHSLRAEGDNTYLWTSGDLFVR